MTTGKPQQMAAASTPHDDLIAELSKLMAQDAEASHAQPSAQAEPVADTPFAVRIPGVAPPVETVATVEPGTASVDAVEPLPRQEPDTPLSANAGAPAPFNFDFNFGQAEPVSMPRPAPEPVAAVVRDEHDAIADLIAAELMGDITPQPVVTEPPAMPAEPAPEPVQPTEPVPPPVTSKLSSWTPAPVAANGTDAQIQPRPAVSPVNLAPSRPAEKPESDSFRIAPVFGLGTTPAPSSAAAPREQAAFVPPTRAEHGYLSPIAAPKPTAPQSTNVDPVDEIEGLIGRAVRGEIENSRAEQPSVSQAPSPALRSLATPTLPPQSASASGVDEAILAAAAATGAEIDWVQPPTGREPAAEPRQARERAPRRPVMLRAFAGPLIAVVLLLVAGFALYSVLGMGGSDGPAPVITADATPVKQVPEAKAAVDQPQSVVFNEMDGVVPGAEEQLVSRDQADVNEVTALPSVANVSEEGLANRKVRTVTVRPDGSIVSGGEDSTAGATILPVDRPNVPAVPGAAAPSSTLLASANASQPTPTPAATPVEPLVPGAEIAVIDATGAPVAGKTAPVPYVRPASVGNAPASGSTSVTAIIEAPQASNTPPPAAAELRQSIAPQASAIAATSAPGPTAPAYVQLSSQRSAEAAQQVANELSARYASLLNGARVEISRADLGERGTYYRVRVPAASRENAAQFCASVVASGGDCLAL